MALQDASRSEIVVVPVVPTGRDRFDIFMFRGAGADMSVTFPAGELRPGDCRQAWTALSRGLDTATARKILGSELAPEVALGHWIAAVRILYEELGILLCTAGGEAPPDKEKLNQGQTLLKNGTLDFIILVQSERLCCNLSRLVYLSHWHTADTDIPALGSRTYLARLPFPGGSPLVRSSSPRDLRIMPERVLEMLDRGTAHMDFQTFATLRILANFDRWETLWDESERL